MKFFVVQNVGAYECLEKFKSGTVVLPWRQTELVPIERPTSKWEVAQATPEGAAEAG